jgi:threonine dehydrogenase-like Zn-dependent dehydrogenase
MLAAVIAQPGRIALVDAPLPEPGLGQVRVRLEGCGVCASSIPVWEGRSWFEYPFDSGKPGHEGWGTIEAFGGDTPGNLRIGERVAMISYRAFAQYDIADSNAIVKIPPVLANAPFPGEALGCAMNILARSDIHRGDSVLIVGIGFLGALLCRLASNIGGCVIAVSRRASSLAIARQSGASHTVMLDNDSDCIGDILTLTESKGCDRVIEAAGTQRTLDIATDSIAVGGRLIIAGYHQGIRQVNMQQWNWRGIDVVNAHERSSRRCAEGIQAAANAIAEGVLDPLPLYTHKFRLDELDRAFEIMRARHEGFVKALVYL